MVAEMVPEKELQPRAFSVMPLVWSIGSIFGPSFGGFFARPTENWPKLFGGSKFLAKYPFALPNLVASSLFAIGITIGVLYLRVGVDILFMKHHVLTTFTRKPLRHDVTSQIMVSSWGANSTKFLGHYSDVGNPQSHTAHLIQMKSPAPPCCDRHLRRQIETFP